MREKNQKICAELLHFEDLFDIIIGINNEKIENIAYLRYELYKYRVGDTIKVKVVREGKEKISEVMSSCQEVATVHEDDPARKAVILIISV